MAYLLGVDTGGTYTDAVILDETADAVIGKAKSLTTRADLALGIGRAVDAALAGAGVQPSQIAMVSLSTTLATTSCAGPISSPCFHFPSPYIWRI